MRVAIIGGGPSGLVTLKYLVTANRYFDIKPVEVQLFEAEEKIGGTFRYRTYEDAELVSSKFLTCFSDFRAPPGERQFMSATRYLEYLDEYCTAFDLWPHIRLSTRVISVRRRPGQGHTIHYRSKDGAEEEWHCDAVAVCSGLHIAPDLSMANIPGIEKVPVVMHSSDFKTREQLGEDKTVVILGVGETAMDIGYMAVNVPTKRVVMCHRGGWVFAPRSLPEVVPLPDLSSKSLTYNAYEPSPGQFAGIPIDCAHSGLFDTAYIHPMVRDSMLPWNFHHFMFTCIVPWVMTGTWLVWDQWVGKPRDPEYHTSKVIFVKSNKAADYINVPFNKAGQASASWLEWIRYKLLRMPTPDLHGRMIDLASWPTHIDDTGRLHFRDDGSPEYERMKDEAIHPDVLILATGYRQEFPFLVQQDEAARGGGGGGGSGSAAHERPYARPATADVRRLWARDDPTVAFVGFLRPQIGAIPAIAEMQAMLWVRSLVSRLEPSAGLPPLPPLRRRDQWHYTLARGPDDRIQHGIDHDSYVYQLALDMGAAPGVTDLARISWRRGWRRGWNIIPSWAFVSQVNPKFRLVGPWRWDGAADVLHGEMWSLVQKNGGFVGVALQTALPFFLFGSLSAVCWVYSSFMGLFGVETRGPYTPADNDDEIVE